MKAFGPCSPSASPTQRWAALADASRSRAILVQAQADELLSIAEMLSENVETMDPALWDLHERKRMHY